MNGQPFSFDLSSNIDTLVTSVQNMADGSFNNTISDYVTDYISSLNTIITGLSYSYSKVEEYSSNINIASRIVFTTDAITNLETNAVSVSQLVEQVLKLAGLLDTLTPEQQAICSALKKRNVVIYGPVNRVSRFSNSRLYARKMFEFTSTKEQIIETKKLKKWYGLSSVRDATAVVRRRGVGASGVGSINPQGYVKTNSGMSFFCKKKQ